MLIGNKDRLAIEVEERIRDDLWIFGTFLLWINGQSVGDASDESVALNGCINWLKDLSEAPPNRFHKGLFPLPTEEVWELLVQSEIYSPGQEARSGSIPMAYQRFDISHLGMSSFDRYVVITLHDEEGRERFLWQLDDQPVYDEIVCGHPLASLAGEVVSTFASKIAK